MPIDEMAPMLRTEANATERLQLRDLEAATARLPQEQRQAILLFALEGCATRSSAGSGRHHPLVLIPRA